MKQTKVVAVSVLGAATLALALLALPSKAADDKSKPGGAPPDMEAMMKKAAEMAAPGPEHKILSSLAGEWQVEVRMWMAGPDTPPTVSKGTCSAKMLLGGRFLQEEFKGEMMGQPFAGLGLTGYDKFNKKYVSTWMDQMGTGIFISEGHGDAAGKVITFEGKMDEPMTGEKGKPTRNILRIESADKHSFEMHDLALGEKSKVMELVYTRKGGS